MGSALLRALGGEGRGDAGVWAGLERQGASSQEGDFENAFKALIIFRSYLPRSVSTVSARSEMLRALGEGGVMQES